MSIAFINGISVYPLRVIVVFCHCYIFLNIMLIVLFIFISAPAIHHYFMIDLWHVTSCVLLLLLLLLIVLLLHCYVFIVLFSWTVFAIFCCIVL